MVEETLEPSNAAARITTGRDGSTGDAVKEAVHHLQEADHDLAHGETGAARDEVKHALKDLEGAEHHKERWVVVNGRRKEVHTARLTFDEVVALAFNPPPHGDGVQITIQ